MSINVNEGIVICNESKICGQACTIGVVLMSNNKKTTKTYEKKPKKSVCASMLQENQHPDVHCLDTIKNNHINDGRDIEYSNSFQYLGRIKC